MNTALPAVDFTDVINFSHYSQLLPLIKNSLIAGLILAVLGGLIGIFVTMRDLSFAVHGISELSFTGAAFALLIGFNVVYGSLIGSLVAALLFAFFSLKSQHSSTTIGIVMPFGLGLGILFLSLYRGRSANKFGLLTGQIVSVDTVQLTMLASFASAVIISLLLLWKPLTFASIDPEVAASRGIAVRALTLVFMGLLGVTVALSIQVVGALLVLSVVITPAAAALKITVNPLCVAFWSVGFSIASVVGGILIAAGGKIPVSPYITTISFALYCAALAAAKIRSGSRLANARHRQPARL